MINKIRHIAKIPKPYRIQIPEEIAHWTFKEYTWIREKSIYKRKDFLTRYQKDLGLWGTLMFQELKELWDIQKDIL
jgi:hypothetical protein